MYIFYRKLLSIFLILLGLTIFLSRKYIFDLLVDIAGPEKIVGKAYVIYIPEGEYLYTNPKVMVLWIVLIALLGISLFLLGLFMFFRRLSNTKIHSPKK